MFKGTYLCVLIASLDYCSVCGKMIISARLFVVLYYSSFIGFVAVKYIVTDLSSVWNFPTSVKPFRKWNRSEPSLGGIRETSAATGMFAASAYCFTRE